MNKSQVEYAERKAKEHFDKWNDVTGVYQVGTGYYDEILSCIEDSVHIGIQIALYNKVLSDKEGNVSRSSTIDDVGDDRRNQF